MTKRKNQAAAEQAKQTLEAIQASTSVAEQSPADEGLYRVNRERLEHDGKPYTFGDLVVIEDEKAAEALLALGAIERPEGC